VVPRFFLHAFLDRFRHPVRRVSLTPSFQEQPCGPSPEYRTTPASGRKARRSTLCCSNSPGRVDSRKKNSNASERHFVKRQDVFAWLHQRRGLGVADWPCGHCHGIGVLNGTMSSRVSPAAHGSHGKWIPASPAAEAIASRTDYEKDKKESEAKDVCDSIES